MTSIKTNPYKAVSFVQSAVEKALEKNGSLIADVKYDGVRGNIVVADDARGLWLSRVAKTIPALEHLNGYDRRWEKLLKDDRWIYPEGFMLDGELMVKGVSFQKGSGLLRTKWLKLNNFEFTEHRVFHDVWKSKNKQPFNLSVEHLCVRLYAILPLDKVESGEDIDVMNCLMQVHCQQMIMVLRDHFPEVSWELAETYDVYDMQSLNELYAEKRAEGHEGLIIKDPTGTYRRGKKTGWWKMKPEDEADGVVVGLNWGTPGLANEGKVIGFQVQLENGVTVDANNISQDLMDEFTKRVKEYTTECNANEAGCWYMNPYEGWQCQVKFMEYTEDGSLRHPSWDCWRGTESDPTVKM
ncbi:DNA ligase [Escherichia phage SRT7]|uniref:DNA ligase n=1 Tax=Escherichia phage SRT7 TaxID=2268589 RepID=A0A2Z5H3H0_9CAUD|nr:DNA ligase [Escherichia phage SRT7]AXC34600.1 ATP-dependent DNA ligase [Escherichia phage SRT7]